MPDGLNGGDLERRVSVLEQARKEMEDAMLVHAHLEAQAAKRIKEHAEFLVRQEEALETHRQKMLEFDEKLNALIDIIGRQQGGLETR